MQNLNNDILDGINNLPELLAARVGLTPDLPGLAVKNEEQKWQWTTWQEFEEHILTMAGHLWNAGCRRGYRVGIMGASTLAWDITQQAILLLGGVVVGMDQHDTDEHIQHILVTAEIKGVVVDNPENLNKIDEHHQSQMLFALEMKPGNGNILSQTILTNPKPSKKTLFSEPQFPSIKAEDTATIIFTSGTTGEPKGIAYSHGQVLAACRAITKTYSDVTSSAHLACWLPLSNLFQRMMNYCAIASGARTYYVPDPRNVLSCLAEIKPTVFIGVPRFYEKLHEGIIKKINQQSWIVRKLYIMALKIGYWSAKAEQNEKKNRSFTLLMRYLADGLFFTKLRQQIFGGQLHYAISGSAPTPRWLLEWFQATGILILEAYGISENIIPIAANTPHSYKFGTVGQIFTANHLRFSADGEIEVKGPGVFKNYVGEVKQGRALTPDNYLRTGDEGFLDDQGFLVLQGRKSDFFKTSTGRRVAPAAAEKNLQKIPFIDHIILIGAGRKVPIALTTIDRQQFCDSFELSQNWKPTGQGTKPLTTGIREAVREELTGIPSFQQPTALILIFKTFSIESGELTANLKLRRSFITTKYEKFIDQAYAQLETSSQNGPLQHLGENCFMVRL